MTFAQKKEIVACEYSKAVNPDNTPTGQTLKAKTVARSSIEGSCNKPGHESRLIAMAEACKSFRLPNELVVKILTHVEGLDMYRVRFAGPGEKRWLSPEDVERSK